MPNIAKALKITGWMRPQELRWLAQQAANCEKIVELGVFRGRSVRAMLDNSDAHIWCVDDWNSRITKKSNSSDIEMFAFLENVADHIERLTVLRMTTEAAAETLPMEAPFDMIFIDADHTYKWVKHDILAYRPMIRPGGLLCGHDAHHAPLMKAVNELVPVHQVTSTIWYARV